MNRIRIYKSVNKTLLVVCLSFIVAHLQGQERKETITIQQENISLKEAFTRIEEQTKYTIAYEQSVINLQQTVSLALKNVNINQALKEILQGLPYTYKIKDYHIILSPRPKNSPSDTNDSQLPTQTVRGRVLDAKTNTPIAFASVSIPESPALATVTDSLGWFRISHVPIGRYTIRTSSIGYNENIIREIVVTSSKETFLPISLIESIHSLKEVIISQSINKLQPLNSMVITGGRRVSMEEAGRFANGFDDPARMASAFAGVAGSVGTNAIAIRGNSPQSTQWRLEGIEIPNPTHFADLSGLGGGFLSALSTQVMGNFDFYNGAFTSEYDNALSGVFDMHMRNGNNKKHEHAFQIGLMGIDLASEGPISKKSGSSYIFNYRLSTTSLAASDNQSNMRYQDLAFKLNFPTKKLGTFSIWGLGLYDKDKIKEEEDTDKWETQGDRQNGKTNFTKAAGGFTHQYLFNETAYIKTSLAATYSHDRTRMNQLNLIGTSIPIADIQNRKWDIVFNSYVNKKFSSKHVNRTGIKITGLAYDLDYLVSPNFGLNQPMERISKGDGSSYMLSLFSSSLIDFTPFLRANIGLTAQYFALNENITFEPRASLKWQFKPQHSLSAAYGLHSRREKIDYYFVKQEIEGKTHTNKFLDLSRAHHFGLSYEWSVSPIHYLKVEPYFQYLFDIPVESGTSFSIINHQEFYLNKILTNKGAGKNYGIDISFEQTMDRGFYYMLTGSLFKSRYKGGDNIWRNTRFDRGYSFNLVTGKEWIVGKQKRNVFGVNTRLFIQGGDRYTPIDEQKTNELHDIEFDETRAFSKKFNPAINADLSINYKINRRKVSHEFALKILNIGGYTGMHYYEYNEKKNHIKKEKGMGIIPNISYKIHF